MLTPQQRNLLDFLVLSEDGGRCPSFREMAAAVGLVSVSGVHRMILALEERGFVRRFERRARAVEVIRRPRREGLGGLASRIDDIEATGCRERGPYEKALRDLAALAALNGVDLGDLLAGRARRLRQPPASHPPQAA